MRLVSRIICSIFIFSLLICFNTSYSQDKILEWKLFHTVKKGWIPAGTCGAVQEILIKTNELPDPFVGTNEKLFQWIESYDWMFESSLEISASDTGFSNLELYFPAIDTYASIYINDSLVLQAENAFRPYSIQAKKWLHVGKNKIRAVFKSPINYHRKAFNALAAKFPSPNDVGEIAVSSMSRKPQYQFGWDWALRMNTIGFMKPVRLLKYSENRIRAAKIETKKINTENADLVLTIELQNTTTKTVDVKSKLFGYFMNVPVKEGKIHLPLVLNNPILWWPNGQGDSYLYEDQVVVELAAANVLTTKVTFGVRTAELIQEKDKWGTSFYMKINDKPVFCKGANYIPQDIFPTKITAASIQELVQQMKKSNFNIVRVWGGGMYPEEAFLEACDEAGIMIWEDFMFACAIYPGDDHFLINVQSELNYQIPRLSAHPAVVLFNGNNEVDVAWKNWGFQTQYKIMPKQQKVIEIAYQKLFQTLIPLTVKSLSSVPYVHTSPLSNWGKEEYYNHGTQHYWGVWHGKDPMEDFAFKSGRFNAEYGFQSFPTLSTIARFSKKEDWKLDSEVMKWHQKSYVGNGMIQKHSDLLFGPAASFEEFIYYSQLTQAKAVGLAISSHRIGSPRCMGSIYWQLNDCWPAPTWSSIDFYGNWKALQFEVKKDFEPITVVQSINKDKSNVYFLVSDAPKNELVNISFSVFALDGKLILKQSKTIDVVGGKSSKIINETLLDSLQKMNYLLLFEWTYAGKNFQRSFYSDVNLKIKAAKLAVKWSLEQIDTVSKTALITIENKEFIADCWVSSKKTGIHFESNFESYLPGKHAIKIQFTELPKKEDFEFQWR